MDKKVHVFKIPFVIFSIEILLKFGLTSPTFEENLKGIIDDEPITYAGRYLKEKEEA